MRCRRTCVYVLSALSSLALISTARPEAQPQWANGFAQIVSNTWPSAGEATMYSTFVGDRRAWGEHMGLPDRPQRLAWKTAPCPEKRDTVFVFLGSNGEDGGVIELSLNGEAALRFTSSVGRDRVWTDPSGCMLFFRFKAYASGNNGLYFLSVPAGKITPGEPLEIRLEHKQGYEKSWFIVMEEPDVLKLASDEDRAAALAAFAAPPKGPEAQAPPPPPEPTLERDTDTLLLWQPKEGEREMPFPATLFDPLKDPEITIEATVWIGGDEENGAILEKPGSFALEFFNQRLQGRVWAGERNYAMYGRYGQPIQDGRRHRIAMTFDRHVLKLYTDGQWQASLPAEGWMHPGEERLVLADNENGPPTRVNEVRVSRVARQFEPVLTEIVPGPQNPCLQVDGRPFFPIGLYMPSHWNVALMAELREAGFNLVNPRSGEESRVFPPNLTIWRRLLDEIDAAGMKAFVGLWISYAPGLSLSDERKEGAHSLRLDKLGTQENWVRAEKWWPEPIDLSGYKAIRYWVYIPEGAEKLYHLSLWLGETRPWQDGFVLHHHEFFPDWWRERQAGWHEFTAELSRFSPQGQARWDRIRNLSFEFATNDPQEKLEGVLLDDLRLVRADDTTVPLVDGESLEGWEFHGATPPRNTWYAADFNPKTRQDVGPLEVRRQWVETFVQGIRDHPALLVYEPFDEIAQYGVPIEGLREGVDLIRKDDPLHPIWLNHADTPLSMDAWRQYSDLADIVSFDAYPLIRETGLAWPDKTLAVVGHYADVLGQIVDHQKPVWMVLQADRFPQPDSRFPSLGELRFMTYDSIVRGATGVLYFGYDISYGWSPQFRHDIKQVASELRDLEEALTAPAYQETIRVEMDPPRSDIKAMCRWGADRKYLFVVNEAPGPSVSVRFTFPELVWSVQAMFENRKLEMEDNAFTDVIEGYGVRIYEVYRPRVFAD